MSCRSTPGSSACVSIAAARSGLDESQVASVMHASIKEASAADFIATEDGYVKRLWVLQRDLDDCPAEFGSRAASIRDRLVAGQEPAHVPTDPHRRYAVVGLEERCGVAVSHLRGLLERAAQRIGEDRGVTQARYESYRAEAAVDNRLRPPRRFAALLADGPFTWAAPRDRVTAWALYRVAQDAGDEPRVENG